MIDRKEFLKQLSPKEIEEAFKMAEEARLTFSDKEYVPTDDWTDQFPMLRDDIDCHIECLSNLTDKEEIYTLRRMIFISIRQHLGNNLKG
ncbi:hypothetical protein N9948_01615 [bacterium]|nr:hypothetical protein [bacterium]